MFAPVYIFVQFRAPLSPLCLVLCFIIIRSDKSKIALSLFLIQTTPCTGKTCIFSCRKIPLERIAVLVTPLKHKVCKYQFAFNKDSNCIVEKNDVDRSTTRRELAYQLTSIYLSSFSAYLVVPSMRAVVVHSFVLLYMFAV